MAQAIGALRERAKDDFGSPAVEQLRERQEVELEPLPQRPPSSSDQTPRVFDAAVEVGPAPVVDGRSSFTGTNFSI
jgi:hypothetical protein